MWKCFLPLFAFLAASVATSSAKPPAAKSVGKAEVRQAITIFRRDPAGVQGSMAKPLILMYAQDSPDVEVVVAPGLMPWVTDKALSEEQGGLLLTAYCAGAIDAQLNGGQAHSAALVAACEQVIDTYHRLQRKEPSLKVPGVEKLIALKQQRKLAGYVEAAGQTKPAGGGRTR